jgi:hypothetical protein
LQYIEDFRAYAKKLSAISYQLSVKPSECMTAWQQDINPTDR